MPIRRTATKRWLSQLTWLGWAATGAFALIGCSADPPSKVQPFDPAPTTPEALPPEACLPEMPGPTESGRLTLPVAIGVGATPAALSVPLTSSAGAQISVSFFGFFLAQPVLRDAAGRAHPATLLTPEGGAAPYGVHLVRLEQPESHSLQLAAAPGSYTSLELSVGLPEPCRGLKPQTQVYPLNWNEMTWAWAGYLHLRFEGRIHESGAFSPQYAEHHMFDAANFTRLGMPGAIQVGAGTAGPTLALDIERMLDQSTISATPTTHGIEGWLMDNLATHQALTLK